MQVEHEGEVRYITLHEYFAAQALIGIIAGRINRSEGTKGVERTAYDVADRMIRKGDCPKCR